MASTPLQVSTSVVRRNKIKTFFSKPYNVILVLMGLVLTVTTVAPIVAIVEDTFKIHPAPSTPTSPDRFPAIPW